MAIVSLANPQALARRYGGEPATRELLTRLGEHCAGLLNHGVEVSVMSIRIGHALGLSERRLTVLARAALLHDVGKSEVPAEVLNKPGKLDAAEWAMVERHPLTGCEMLLQAGLAEEARIVLHHHERFDGGGYPSGRAGRDIPIESRILAVADAYDAMTSARPYRAAMSPAAAMTELRNGAGRQHDADCVDALAGFVFRAAA
jgi:putative nucleotidyltransferase with HDIG domain